jgi:hypothetical protein
VYTSHICNLKLAVTPLSSWLNEAMFLLPFLSFSCKFFFVPGTVFATVPWISLLLFVTMFWGTWWMVEFIVVWDRMWAWAASGGMYTFVRSSSSHHQSDVIFTLPHSHVSKLNIFNGSSICWTPWLLAKSDVNIIPFYCFFIKYTPFYSLQIIYQYFVIYNI